MTSIKSSTERLLSVCEECLERHAEMRRLDREPDFFNEVKPYSDEQFELLNTWKEEIETWIRREGPKYIHMQQILALDDMMRQFIVQSFYQKTGKKRFVQSIQSARYTLQTILNAIEEREEDRS
ncbi:YppE family protein [Sporosarcina sp. Te-1]|uniref:YppE family protein n=1 Tax=Sporosarcina sp. Te-1 TaxID=2818390 RepID=UPI001A9FC098|nr:YppE family protein [Sporosarcina sp. Te-1]QTD42147.1 YppE family protein [Sporosarcina sp. Te-1]